MKKVAVVTGTRAEYGLLKPLIAALHADSDLQLQLIATGSHLSHEFGKTYRLIEQDGFAIDSKVEMLLSGDSPAAIGKSVGLACIGFADAFNVLQPDMLVVLGDRYEILAAAQVANIFNIPIAHLHGGELSEGAIDDSFRHAIAKMSYLHFAATKEYCRRLIQLGEEPNRVFHTGAITLDTINKLPTVSTEKLGSELGIELSGKIAMVTYHSVTKAGDPSAAVKAMLAALDAFPDLKVIFTGTNADTEGRIINSLLQEYVAKAPGRAAFHTNLGENYLHTLQHVDLVLGNSSSGILETPFFHIPTVNLGNRQRGRVMPDSVVCCDESVVGIKAALQKALSDEFVKFCKAVQSPYDAGVVVSEAAVKEIKAYFAKPRSGMKKFYDVMRYCN